MAKVLVVHASRHGSTSEVAVRSAERIRAAGKDVDVRAARDARGALEGYELVVVGGAIYSGRWHTDAHRFLKRRHDELTHIPVAVFAMGPRRDEEESWQRARSQLVRAVAKRGWLHPVDMTVFGGLDLKPKRGQPPGDIRNWQAIDAWADHLASLPPRETPSSYRARRGDYRALGGALTRSEGHTRPEVRSCREGCRLLSSGLATT